MAMARARSGTGPPRTCSVAGGSARSSRPRGYASSGVARARASGNRGTATPGRRRRGATGGRRRAGEGFPLEALLAGAHGGALVAEVGSRLERHQPLVAEHAPEAVAEGAVTA